MSAQSLVELICEGGLTVVAGHRRVSGDRLRESARRGAGVLATFPPGAGILVDVAEPVRAIEVALAGWWAGLRVAFARTDSPYDLARQAAVVDAAVVVTDSAGPGVRISPVELLGSPVPWAPRCAGGDAALDVFSSGTSGDPKCVVFTHAAMVANGVAMATAMDVHSDDRLWTPLPHGLPGVIGTVILPAAAHGATAVLDRPGVPMCAVGGLSAAQPSIVYAVPELYEAMSRSTPPATIRPDRIRLWLSSSSRLSRTAFDRMLDRWGAVVRSCYCAVETGAVTFNGGVDVEAARDTVGSPLSGVHVEIDHAGRSAVGRIVVRGDLVAAGYRDRDGVVEFPDSTVVTGDLGWLDTAGSLHLVGRADDRINVGAETVDPSVVEAQLESLDGVGECLVTAKPHPRLGSVLEARIVRTDGVPLTERAVIRHCRARGLTGAWVPWTVTWVDSIPKTSAGKPIRTHVPA